MFGLSTAQLHQAADAAICAPPSTHSNTTGDITSSTQHLQQKVTTNLQQLNDKQWSCQLPFFGLCPISGPPYKQCDDILDFCRKFHPMTGRVFRFSSDSYPPTEEGLKELVRELKCAAKLSGSVDLIAGGIKTSHKKIITNVTTEPQLCFRVVCNCGVISVQKA